MEGAEKLVLAIYTRFVLRDFVGKVIPGGMGIFGVSALIIGFRHTVEIIHKLSAFELSILVAIAWIAAIFMQSFGSALKLPGPNRRSFFAYFPGDFFTSTVLVNRFLRIATEDEKAQYERFVVIKEAAGNTAISLLLLFILTFYSVAYDYWKAGKLPHYADDWKLNIALISIWIIAILYLRRMHNEHVDRQFNYVTSTIEKSPL